MESGRPLRVGDGEGALGQPTRLALAAGARFIEILYPNVAGAEILVDNNGVVLFLLAALVLVGLGIASGVEDLRPVGRDRERLHTALVIGRRPGLATVGVQHVDLIVGLLFRITIGSEGNPIALREPSRRRRPLGGAGELAAHLAVDTYAPDLAHTTQIFRLHVALGLRKEHPAAVG